MCTFKLIFFECFRGPPFLMRIMSTSTSQKIKNIKMKLVKTEQDLSQSEESMINQQDYKMKQQDKIHDVINDKIQYKIHDRTQDKIHDKMQDKIHDKIQDKIHDKIYIHYSNWIDSLSIVERFALKLESFQSC